MALPDLARLAEQLEDGSVDSAIEGLESFVDRYPAHGLAHLLLARAYRKQGRREQSLRQLSRSWFWLGEIPAVHEERLAIAEADALTWGESSSSAAGAEDSTDAESEPDPEEAASDEEDAADPGEAEIPTGEPAIPDGDRPEELEADLKERLGNPEIEDDEDLRDLDTLIRELEGARISPEPDVGSGPERPAQAGEDEEDGEEEEEVVSETLARIYERQKEFAAAAEAYRELAEEHPERSEEFFEKSKEMERKAEQP